MYRINTPYFFASSTFLSSISSALSTIVFACSTRSSAFSNAPFAISTTFFPASHPTDTTTSSTLSSISFALSIIPSAISTRPSALPAISPTFSFILSSTDSAFSVAVPIISFALAAIGHTTVATSALPVFFLQAAQSPHVHPGLQQAHDFIPLSQHPPSQHATPLQHANGQKHRLPLPHTSNAIATTTKSHAIIVSGVVHPSIFKANTMITNVSIAHTFVSLQHPETRNNHARISPTTAIQNHAVVDKNVRPSICAALPTPAIISGLAEIFEIHAQSIQRPKTIRSTPSTLLHNGEHCFIHNKEKVKKP